MDNAKFNELVEKIVDLVKDEDFRAFKSSEAIIVTACMHHYYAWINEGEDAILKAVNYLHALNNL